RASGPTISETWVRKAMTSCLVVRSISSMRSASHTASRPPSQIAAAESLGMVPSSAMASAAWASISNQILYLVACDQMSAASARAYLGIMAPLSARAALLSTLADNLLADGAPGQPEQPRRDEPDHRRG